MLRDAQMRTNAERARQASPAQESRAETLMQLAPLAGGLTAIVGSVVFLLTGKPALAVAIGLAIGTGAVLLRKSGRMRRGPSRGSERQMRADGCPEGYVKNPAGDRCVPDGRSDHELLMTDPATAWRRRGETAGIGMNGLPVAIPLTMSNEDGHVIGRDASGRIQTRDGEPLPNTDMALLYEAIRRRIVELQTSNPQNAGNGFVITGSPERRESLLRMIGEERLPYRTLNTQGR